MSAKQDRQGVRTASQLEQKYQFGKTFADLLGLINESRDHVDEVESSVKDEIKQMSSSIGRNAEEIRTTVSKLTETTEKIDRTGEELESIRQTMTNQHTELLETAETITLSALKDYVEKSEYNELAETLETELKVQAANVEINFKSSSEQVTEANEAIQRISEILEKHFDFSVNGLIIKAGDNEAKLVLDNGIAYFELNGQKKTTIEPDSVKTGNIFVGVDEMAQFGNYGFVPFEDDEADGLDLVRVGG